MSKPTSSLLRHATDLRVVNFVLFLIWLIAIRYCQVTTYYDPSSYFFRSDAAYEPFYSAIREQEADDYLDSRHSHHNRLTKGARANIRQAAPSYCIGIPTLQRERAQFFPRTAASLVDTLTPEQRELIHIIVLLSDTDATENSAFGQDWLHAIADTVIVHEDTPEDLVSENGYQTIPRHFEVAARDERVRRDYAVLSETCRLNEADYFILVEDDVIAARDWFERLQAATPVVNERAVAKRQDWLYIRLFYTETYMGWNSEEWGTYSRNIALIYMAVLGVMLAVRHLHQKTSASLKERTSKHSKLLMANILMIWVPLFIALGFMAGRLTVSPLPTGVLEMPRYGCCSQGLVIPNRHLTLLKDRFLDSPFDLPADSTIEKTADDLDLGKWAVVPSVLQHIGARGSSAKGGAIKSTWNFSFERFYSA
ncbi:glycosyltransferase [Trichoderma citrinoviride]|uniref:Glycosyltransferase n=1 Tax=Trichoderma citrinoviride TaxID=58853 RepID=A0A2T4AZ29_9HYPO|nr:glycosyltransferase [Trichoderma citrinoviride]PTB62325.1 glycosyltransferase [Trichoderma citrinoviride]